MEDTKTKYKITIGNKSLGINHVVTIKHFEDDFGIIINDVENYTAGRENGLWASIDGNKYTEICREVSSHDTGRTYYSTIINANDEENVDHIYNITKNILWVEII